MTPLLRVSGLAKRYGERVAVDRAGFELFPGEVIAVVGESGSGKTISPRCRAARRRGWTRWRYSSGAC